ncbi:hypothetical protein [Pelagibacterium montanilacus]|uniref:hypothetical protein n=1 Tax=Pelagibacterium montanilacus TaxID=2185280 RepID=UPI0013DEEE82|nr:hypothetical protein [Pelagibacterium montanilacus]
MTMPRIFSLTALVASLIFVIMTMTQAIGVQPAFSDRADACATQLAACATLSASFGMEP